MDRSIRRTLIILLLVVAAVFALVVGQQVITGSGEPAPAPDLSDVNTYVYDEARPLASFKLTSDTGDTVTRDDLKGRWTFVFVGFTHCPDICPATLATLGRAIRQLPPELPRPDALLVSADPERDTPERLREYLAVFGDEFQGLTGDLDTLRKLARSLSAVFVHSDDGTGNRQVEHSAHLALLNPEGELQALIQPPHSTDKLIEAYRSIYEWARANHPRTDKQAY